MLNTNIPLRRATSQCFSVFFRFKVFKIDLQKYCYFLDLKSKKIDKNVTIFLDLKSKILISENVRVFFKDFKFKTLRTILELNFRLRKVK